MKKLLDFVLGLQAAAGSLKGYVSAVELFRVVATAATAGGGILAVLSAVGANAGTIFVSPDLAAAAAAVIAAIVQVVRFLNHGDDPTPPPPIRPRY